MLLGRMRHKHRRLALDTPDDQLVEGLDDIITTMGDILGSGGRALATKGLRPLVPHEPV